MLLLSIYIYQKLEIRSVIQDLTGCDVSGGIRKLLFLKKEIEEENISEIHVKKNYVTSEDTLATTEVLVEQTIVLTPVLSETVALTEVLKDTPVFHVDVDIMIIHSTEII